MVFTEADSDKIKIQTLADKLQQATDALTIANANLAKREADDIDATKIRIVKAGGISMDELEGKSLADLKGIEALQERFGVDNSAGIKKSNDTRKSNDMSVGRWNPTTKIWEGGINP
jgi:hypothetical protein